MNAEPIGRRITATDLVGQKSPGELAVSPDGTSIAFTLSEVDFTRSEIRTQIHRAPEPEGPGVKGGARQITHALDDSTHPAWSPDGKAIAFLCHRPQPHDEDDHHDDGRPCQVFLLSVEGGDARRVTDLADGAVSFRFWPDGSGVVTLGRAVRSTAEKAWRRQRRDNYDDAHVVHENLPKYEIWRHPFEGSKERLLPGARGIDEFDVSPDGKLLVYSTNHTGRPEDSDRSEVILRELSSGEERPLTGGRGGAETGPRFSADGRFVLFHGWADPKIAFSRQELFAVAVPTAMNDELEPPRSLLAEIDRDLEDLAMLPDGRVAAAVAWGMESRVFLIEPASGAHKMLDVEGKVLTHLTASPFAGGATRIAALSEDAASLPEVGFLDFDPDRFEPCSSLHDDPPEWCVASRRRVSWESEGMRHEGLLLSPVQPGHLDRGQPPPMVVWVHGGPHWRAQDTLQTYEAEVLVGEGYAVFLPQFRGSSGYSEAYALASIGDLAGADARDILAGVDHVVELGLADPERLAVAGASYGGYMTNWLLATTGRFRAGISMFGIFDLTHDFSTSAYASWEIHYLGKPPWEAPELYRARSPLTHASTIDAPVLILHGLEDDTTDFTNSKGLYRALTTLGRTAELVLYPREGHGLFEPAHRVDALHRILDWLNTHVADGDKDRSIHVAGRRVAGRDLEITPLGHVTRKDYSGVRPGSGRVFLEVSVLVEARESDVELLRILPCGASSDLVLVDEFGDIHRPVGVPLAIQDQPVLFAGRGALEAWRSEEGLAPSLPVSVVFEIPSWPGLYELRFMDMPPVVLDVLPEPDENADENEPPTDSPPGTRG